MCSALHLHGVGGWDMHDECDLRGYVSLWDMYRRPSGFSSGYAGHLLQGRASSYHYCMGWLTIGRHKILSRICLSRMFTWAVHDGYGPGTAVPQVPEARQDATQSQS